jgi:hypothetical protein
MERESRPREGLRPFGDTAEWKLIVPGKSIARVQEIDRNAAYLPTRILAVSAAAVTFSPTARIE